MFYAVNGDCDEVLHDLKIENGGLAGGDESISAALIQLMTNARVGDECGWWADQFMPFALGSRLWSIRDGDLGQIDGAIRDALNPLIEQGVIDAIRVRSFETIDGRQVTVDLSKDGQSVFEAKL